MPSFFRSVSLPTGVLRLTWDPQTFQLDDLCEFACRRNANRSFLFVSKVLGRYRAVKPHSLRNASRRLASQLLQLDLPGPVVFVGLVEAGVALGHAVFEDAIAQSCRDDFVFLQTTRYRLEQPVLAEFAEEHSHAPQHFLYRPSADKTARRLAEARSLVLVDDEATSGRTFENLRRVLAPQLPRLSHVRDVTATDWRAASTGEYPSPPHYEHVSLFRGEYAFQSNGVPPGCAADANGNDESKDAQVDLGLGRLGFGDTLGWDEPSLAKILSSIRHKTVEHHSTPAPSRVVGGRVLVIGTGEFVYPPLLLAERLTDEGHDVEFIATTRSPVERGFAVNSVLEFADNYGDGIPNYIYNVDPARYSQVLFCQETPPVTTPWPAITQLGADVLQFTAKTNGVLSLRSVVPVGGQHLVRPTAPARAST
jgi:hypothetical protein